MNNSQTTTETEPVVSEQAIEEFLTGGDDSLGDRAQRAWKREVADYLSGKDCWLRRQLHGDE